MLNKGGHTVKAGTYWNLANVNKVQMEEIGVLPGDRSTRYIKAPVAVMLMAAPVIGLLFAVFLPFIGIAMTLSLIGKKLANTVTEAAAGSMSFGWRPIEAYLAALSAPPAERLETRLSGWYAGVERYAVQLHELEQDEYLAMKRKEARQP